MNIFTITTDHPEWNLLTRECVLRVKAYSGHDIRVIQAKDQWDAHVLKLTIPLHYEEPVWFVDSDWWPVKPFEFPEIPEDGFAAPYCSSGHGRYITTCADTSKVFASTILGADMGSWKVKQAFRNARAMQSAAYWDGRPKMDEFFLNVAVLSHNMPITYLGGEWVWNGKVSLEAIAVHAGAMWPKLEWLKEQCASIA